MCFNGMIDGAAKTPDEHQALGRGRGLDYFSAH
jgi:hypothetical protein